MSSAPAAVKPVAWSSTIRARSAWTTRCRWSSPEINARRHQKAQGIIAHPNCTTAVTLMALYPLHQAFQVKPNFASSYQAVSGTGAKAIEELERQVSEIVAGKPVTKQVYPHQIAFNVFPIDFLLPTGYTKEEMKMQNEGRKIMHHPTLKASVTCVRVPVLPRAFGRRQREFEKPVSVEAARAVLAKGSRNRSRGQSGEERIFPAPLGRREYNCQVGRIRLDCALENGLCFWVAGDQLLKGAA